MSLQELFKEFQAGAINFDSMLLQAKQGMYRQYGMMDGEIVHCISPSTASTLNVMWEEGVINQEQRDALFRLAKA